MKKLLSLITIITVCMMTFCGTLYAVETVQTAAVVAATPRVPWLIMGCILAGAAFLAILGISRQKA